MKGILEDFALTLTYDQDFFRLTKEFDLRTCQILSYSYSLD